MNSVKYFQKMTASEDKVLFVLNSNFWDVCRYKDNGKYFLQYMSVDDYKLEFERNYTKVIHMLQNVFRPKDKLILSVPHSPKPKHHCLDLVLIAKLRRSALKIGFHLSLPIFRADRIVEHTSSKRFGYLQDHIHQSRHASVLLTKDFINSFIF